MDDSQAELRHNLSGWVWKLPKAQMHRFRKLEVEYREREIPVSSHQRPIVCRNGLEPSLRLLCCGSGFDRSFWEVVCETGG